MWVVTRVYLSSINLSFALLIFWFFSLPRHLKCSRRRRVCLQRKLLLRLRRPENLQEQRIRRVWSLPVHFINYQTNIASIWGRKEYLNCEFWEMIKTASKQSLIWCCMYLEIHCTVWMSAYVLWSSLMQIRQENLDMASVGNKAQLLIFNGMY